MDEQELAKLDPPEMVIEAVERSLREAGAWLTWDGRPTASEGSVWTPHKGLRRVTDHLIDHLTHTEMVLAGDEPFEDTWKGRMVTMPADLAPFTEMDLSEAGSRLRRLARVYAVRLRAAGPEAWDAERDGAWTLRKHAEHCALSLVWYAAQPSGRFVPMPD
ncbi:MAG: hypothetical protein ABR600_08650 [Actinomycetota bacterium]